MKKIILLALFLVWPLSSFAADVTLSWDANPAATGYKIQMSIDQGKTWQAEQDSTAATFLYKSVPDTGLVLFRIASYNAASKTYRTEAGAWYCGDWKPIVAPVGAGIR